MPLVALGLVLGGAFLHAFWNLLVRQSANPTAFLYFSILVSVGVFAPIALLTTPINIAPALVPILIVSGLAEVGYVISLSRAYEHGDLSLVYPLARGSAPFFVTLWSMLFIGERLPTFGLLGVGLIVCGIYLTTLPSLRDWARPIRSLELVSSRWALLSGICISIYTLADREGVRLVSPLIYNFYVFASMAIGVTPYILLSRSRLTARRELGVNWLGITATGIVNLSNYLLILWALTLLPASYVSAVRGSSIVMGAFYGWRLRGERLGANRVIAVVLIALGITSLAIGG
ncbi:MAG: DMT family transporter [Chloroflexi bacterium]|nr:DMT family transporter [Chloroflexota bacterium]